jgi:ACR3 family arsenite efflux pump ArsB
MSFGDLIDGVFRLLRANARALAPLLLVLAVPFEALSAYATRNSAGLSQVLSNLADLQNRQFSLSTTDLVLSVVAELGIFLMTPVVAGVVCRTVAISYIGEQPGSRQVSRLGARLLLALVVASVMVHALELVASVLCLLPGMVVMASGRWPGCAGAGGS